MSLAQKNEQTERMQMHLYKKHLFP